MALKKVDIERRRNRERVMNDDIILRSFEIQAALTDRIKSLEDRVARIESENTLRFHAASAK